LRKFLSGAGYDSTAAVLAYLAEGNQLLLADLVLIGEIEDPAAVWLTSWNSPLAWPIYGTFQPATIKRGQVTSQIGLQVDTLAFSWSPPLTAFGTTAATANPYQKAQSGIYDNELFRMWRAVMPTPGDCNTYGACEWFGGRVADVEIVRGQLNFTINSFLDVVNQKVPPNVIEVNNTLANYAGATPVVVDAEVQVPQFEVVTPGGPAVSSATSIWATCLSPTPGKAYGLNKFQNGYMVFNPGSSLAGYWSPIYSSGNQTILSVDYNHFLVFGSFPWPPTPGDTFYCSTKPPISLQDAEAGFGYYGFAFVPQPEGAA